MNRDQNRACPDCDSFSRRTFLHAAGGVAAVATASQLLGESAQAAPTMKSSAETVAADLYKSLSEEQRKVVCFPFEHELRKKINANWHITQQIIESAFYTKAQQDLAREIVKKVLSEDGYEKMLKQTEYDDGGIGAYSMALFGTPDSGKFQWTLTGRHLTLRADGDSVDKAAFGGPLIYGHGEEDHRHNLYRYQTEQTNEVFKALDEGQAKKALLPNAPSESAVTIQGESGQFPGISVGDLKGDQQELVEKTLKVLLAPYRAEDADEVMEMLKADGGVKKLHMAFYQNGDLGQDKVWDIWRVEGPSFVWHFRGAPHVHAYINIAAKS
jgi:hypothetical protein